jgi:hypothetical protein
LASPFVQSANFIAPYLKNPYSDQWTVGLQQMFGANTMLSINYVGSRTTHMPCCGYYNVAITPGPGTVASRAPYPYISPTQYEQSNGSSVYDALQVQLQKRMSSGLAYTINYTWSKTIDVACDGYFGAEGCFIRNPYNPAADRSVAGIDLPQMVTAHVMYQLPFGKGERFQTGNPVADAIVGGWQLNAITTFTSGSPFTVSYSGDEANTGNTYQGINQVGNPNLAHPTVAEWFNKAALRRRLNTPRATSRATRCALTGIAISMLRSSANSISKRPTSNSAPKHLISPIPPCGEHPEQLSTARHSGRYLPLQALSENCNLH